MIAYSQHKIVNGTLRADTTAHFIADLEAQLIIAGWTFVRNVTGGFVYSMTTPDSGGYQAKMLVQDDVSFHADHPTVDLYNFRSPVIWIMNMAETVVSFQYQLRSTGVYPSYQTVIGKAQIFISVPGHDGTGWSSFAAGIPAIPIGSRVCVHGLTPPTITDIWWACGGAQWGFDFRTFANCYACMSHYLNGVVVIAPDNNSISPTLGYLCLFPLTSPDTYSSGVINWPTITYSAHSVLNIDAFLGWEWNLRGQLWDAFLQTAATTLDQVQEFLDVDSTGSTFQVTCLTWHSEFFSSLQLITDVVGVSTGNQSY